MAKADVFLDRTTRILCSLAIAQTRKVLKSRTLRRALTCKVEMLSSHELIARVSVPHYWAVYYHDGRGPIRAKKGKFLVYFRNIEDDPRITGTASPERYADTKRLSLSPATFRRMVDEGKMIVTKGVRASAPRPFFKPLRQFRNQVRPVVGRHFSRFVRDDLETHGLLRFSKILTIPLRG